jgi:hypothetical protein
VPIVVAAPSLPINIPAGIGGCGGPLSAAGVAWSSAHDRHPVSATLATPSPKASTAKPDHDDDDLGTPRVIDPRVARRQPASR